MEAVVWTPVVWTIYIAMVVDTLHNMIIEDENEQANIRIDLNMNPGASIALPPEVSTQVNPCFQDVIWRNSQIQDKAEYIALKKDLVECIWERYGKK
jgi:hypothetical protein